MGTRSVVFFVHEMGREVLSFMIGIVTSMDGKYAVFNIPNSELAVN